MPTTGGIATTWHCSTLPIGSRLLIPSAAALDVQHHGSTRHAIVTPLLKKPGLDAANISNNLSFVSKVVERAVTIRLNDYLIANDLLPRPQSAYRKKHSTETATLRVWSDRLSSVTHRVSAAVKMSDHTRNMTCQQRSTVSIMISSCSDCSSASVWFGVVLETGVDPVVPD